MGEKIIVIISVIVLSMNASAQGFEGRYMIYEPKTRYIVGNSLEASATLSPSAMLNRKDINFYLHAYAQYHLPDGMGIISPRVSLRSDNYLFLNSSNDEGLFRNAYRSHFGVIYKVANNERKVRFPNIHPYLGFQPGVAIIRTTADEILGEDRFSIQPSISFTAGMTAYFWKYFNFFARASYIHSNVRGTLSSPFKADELIISTGLGFHIAFAKQGTFE